MADDVIKNFSDINESLCPIGYSFQQYDNGVLFFFFKLTNSHLLISEVTGCIQVDSELHAKLFHERCSVSLAQ